MRTAENVGAVVNFATAHWLSTVVIFLFIAITIGLLLGDGTPNYKQYPFVGQGLLKPWLNWSTADRWRIHELEHTVFEKILDETVVLLNDEANFVFAKEVGDITDWKQFKTMELSSKLVHYISNRILVGPELCRRADYRVATESLNMSHVIFGTLWNFISLGPFRKTFYWVFSIPYRMQIRRAMDKYIVPIVKERMAKNSDEIFHGHLDTIQLMVEMPHADPKEVDAFRHALRLLHLHFASTGSTIGLVHNAIWQLLKIPECVGPIRAEIAAVLEKYGSWDSKHTLNHLHLLDSFVRETLHVHIPSALVFLRVAQQPLTLHDGFHLEQGTRITFPAQSIHFDPSNYENPRDFIPFRFSSSGPCDCEADSSAKDVGRVKAEAIDQTYLPFGYGKQSCPGWQSSPEASPITRFFAIRVTKLILGRLIYEYDMKKTDDFPPNPISGSMEGFFLPVKKFDVFLRTRASHLDA
ncbi:cytochrome P450 [Bimuria novae-zelandiae CBS 107.79]|uniref:Cytochrome P450 n=1 Tax=Bimuria novae-zelandiae CBS 107.79 TaxID=1447943 RepID=A0A6A5VP52_9PLEO|nr:cytochrome P450 [Bimuria novae-zelandiae CBS 107.79]